MDNRRIFQVRFAKTKKVVTHILVNPNSNSDEDSLEKKVKYIEEEISGTPGCKCVINEIIEIPSAEVFAEHSKVFLDLFITVDEARQIKNREKTVYQIKFSVITVLTQTIYAFSEQDVVKIIQSAFDDVDIQEIKDVQTEFIERWVSYYQKADGTEYSSHWLDTHDYHYLKKISRRI